jgi:hypothetical protein
MLYSLGLGAIVFAAFAIGGNPADGAQAFALLAIIAAVVWLGDSARDERWAAIDLRASAFGGLAMILAATGAWLVQLAEGRDGNPYGRLLAVAGVAYLAAVAFLRRRCSRA